MKNGKITDIHGKQGESTEEQIDVSCQIKATVLSPDHLINQCIIM